MNGREHEAASRLECEEAHRALRDLQATAAALARPLDPPDVAAHLLELAQRFLDAPAGVVSVATGAGRFEVLAERGLPDESVRPFRLIEFREAPPYLRRMLEGEELWLETPDEIVDRFPVWADFPAKTGTGAWAFVPIRSGDRPLGTLSLFWQGGHSIDEIQRSFLRTLAQQGGFALDRARLLADQNRHRADAEDAAARERRFSERIDYLQRITSGLVGARAPEEVARLVFDQGLRLLGARACAILLREDHVLARVFSVGFPPWVDELYATMPMDAELPATEVVRTARPIWLASPEAIDARYPHLRRERGSDRSWAAVPLAAGARVLGGLFLTYETSQAFDENEQRFVLSLSAATALAIDRVRLIADIAEAKALLDALIDAAPAGVAFADLDLRLRRVNGALAAAVRRPAEALLGRPVGDLLGPVEGPAATAELARILATGTPVVDRDVAAPGADGERHLLASVFRVDAGGRTIGVGGIVRDVTELRRAEEFRRHLLAIVGHDLRSPLAAITVSVGLLLRQHRFEQREVATLSRVLASAGKIERILRDLLDWASAEAGHTLPLSPREASIADVCRGAADEALAVDPARSVAVEGEGDPRGRWDPDRLAQVLGNLVGNAFKHGRAGAPVRVRWRGTGDEVAVEVENQGEPIPPALRRRIFEPFRRGAATGGPGGGLGLGLYIARELVRAHGGTIAVRSGGGTTTFTVRLPRAAAAP